MAETKKNSSKKKTKSKKSTSTKKGRVKTAASKKKSTSESKNKAAGKQTKKTTKTPGDIVAGLRNNKTSLKTTYKKVIQPEKKKKKEKKIIPSGNDSYDEKSLNRGDKPMSVVGHLDELRSRLMISLGLIIILTIAGFFFSDYLLAFMKGPFEKTGHKLNIFKITGGFVIRLKASLIAGLIIGLPMIIYQVWKYIAPAVSKEDKTFARTSLFASIFLFYGGMSFVFFILLPFAIDMLIKFIDGDMLSTIGADDYLSFILLLSVSMGVLFELPIVVMILTKIGIVTPRFLITKRKYSVVLIWIIAALITPQDILSQVLVAVPLMFLYEVSIVISKMIMIRKKNKELKEGM